MVEILQVRLQQYLSRELPDVQAGFIKGRGTRDCQHPLDHRKSQSSRKTSTSALLTLPKPVICDPFCADPTNGLPAYLKAHI